MPLGKYSEFKEKLEKAYLEIRQFKSIKCELSFLYFNQSE